MGRLIPFRGKSPKATAALPCGPLTGLTSNGVVPREKLLQQIFEVARKMELASPHVLLTGRNRRGVGAHPRVVKKPPSPRGSRAVESEMDYLFLFFAGDFFPFVFFAIVRGDFVF